MLKVNLIVVSGKPEGKVIPLALPVFRIGRDETCHLRPNSVEVSRQHTELTVTDTAVLVRDLGSRNGTLVNGTLLNGTHRLRSGELLKVGPLTFAVSIQETAESAATLNNWNAPAMPKAAALDDAPQAHIESWLVADNARPTPDRPSGVYDGDTLTIDSYTGSGGQVPGRASAAQPPSSPAQPAAKSAEEAPIKRVFEDENLEFDRLEEGTGDPDEETAEQDTDGGEDEEAGPSEMLDESNPFFIPKKVKVEDAKKDSYKDTSDAANDILRKMLERRRARS
jgi:pSer/pThr/pTyr-binding forkhead associated (FHA) protein